MNLKNHSKYPIVYIGSDLIASVHRDMIYSFGLIILVEFEISTSGTESGVD